MSTVSLVKAARVVDQLGSFEECARNGCKAGISFRVILGHFNVQVLVCSKHLPWAVRLDLLSQDTGVAMGWQHGYPNGYGVELRTTMVVAEMPTISRVDFARNEAVNISATYPRTGPGGVPLYRRR